LTSLFSYCFRYLGDFVAKMQGTHICSFSFVMSWRISLGFSHADRIGGDPSLIKHDRIQKVVCEGGDIFNMLPEVCGAFAYVKWRSDLHFGRLIRYYSFYYAFNISHTLLIQYKDFLALLYPEPYAILHCTLVSNCSDIVSVVVGHVQLLDFHYIYYKTLQSSNSYCQEDAYARIHRNWCRTLCIDTIYATLYLCFDNGTRRILFTFNIFMLFIPDAFVVNARWWPALTIHPTWDNYVHLLVDWPASLYPLYQTWSISSAQGHMVESTAPLLGYNIRGPPSVVVLY
jgi:hypothetical protein